MAKRATTLHSIINELVERTNTDTQRIRALEQREEGMFGRIDSLESEFSEMNNKLMKITQDMENALKQRDISISEIQNTMKEIINQVKRIS